MKPLLRQLGTAASHGLLTGQIVFSAAFVGAAAQLALALGRGGVPMSGSIPATAYVEHFDPELAHHRAWLLAVLERLVTRAAQALDEGGMRRRLWTEHQQSASSTTQSQQPRTCQPLSEASSAVPTSPEAHRGNPLSMPWFSQLDSSTDQARRMCFSSSCAMLLAFLRPGALSSANGDDQDLEHTPTHLIVHVPLGEADLVSSATVGGSARFCRPQPQPPLRGPAAAGGAGWWRERAAAGR